MISQGRMTFFTLDGEKGYRNRDEVFIEDISSKSELTIGKRMENPN
ncbi:hypothetical protein GCM10009597_46360 [Peribacillus frigoritolerans]